MSEKQTIPRKPISPGSHPTALARPEDPPPYSSGPSSLLEGSHNVAETLPGYGSINFPNFIPSNASLSDDQTTVTLYSPKLCSNPIALGKFLQEQAALPPKLSIRIRGTHSSNTAMAKVIDFDLSLNMMPLLITQNATQSLHYIGLIGEGEEAYRGGSTKTMKSSPADPKNINQWIHKFCTDTAKNKNFTLVRVVTNLNTSYLEGQIRNLLASAAYRGHLTVDFPTTYSVTVVSTASPGLFGINFSALLGGTHRYEVTRAVWPYANAPSGFEGRRCAVTSEEVWWGTWKEAIQSAALARRQGAVTLEDRVEVAMNPPREGAKVAEWGVES